MPHDIKVYGHLPISSIIANIWKGDTQDVKFETSSRDSLFTAPTFDFYFKAIKKSEEEESRYSKAYGTGTLEFEQFQNLMKDAKKRKLGYKKQLEELANKTAQISIEISADELVEEVQNIIKKIDFSDKFKVIRDIIDKVTIIERSGAEICAHLPLPVTITEKLGYELERRNCRTT